MIEDKIDFAFIEYACDWFGDTNRGLSLSDIRKLCNKYSLKYNVAIVSKTNQRQNKSKAIVFTEVMNEFSGEQQYKMIMELCNMDRFTGNKKTKEIQLMLIDKYGHFAPDLSAELDKELINETRHFLDGFPDAKEAFEKALAIYKAKSFERELVDNLRVAYELLLRSILKMTKH